MNNTLRVALAIVALVLVWTPAGAQNEKNNWIFGYHSRASFGPIPYNGIPSINSDQACSSISDSAGNLQFYTDGVWVWNRNGAVMPGVQTTQLQGYADTSQGALIVPKPGSGCNEYYIFTTQSPFNFPHPTLMYSVVQMNAMTGGGLGDVTVKNVVLQPDVSSQITAVGDGTGNYWVMSHSYGGGGAPNNVFYPFYVSASGVTPMPSSTGYPHITGHNIASNGLYAAGWGAVGQMKFSQDGTRVASAVPSKYVEVCNFNKVNGLVSGCIVFNSDLSLLHFPFDASTVYGIEFAPLGRYLYVSTYGEAFPSPGSYCQLVQFDLQIPGPGVVVATSPSNYRGKTDMGELQLAPDGSGIYLARHGTVFLSGTYYISRVPFPDNPYPSCGFVQFGKALSGMPSWGLPNMVQGPLSCATCTMTTINGVTFCCSTDVNGQTCCKRLCPVGSTETNINGATLCCTAKGGSPIGSGTTIFCCSKP